VQAGYTLTNQLNCQYYEQAICRSCSQLRIDYAQQGQHKQTAVETALSALDNLWLPMVPSRVSGFRNKAKMVVSGNHPYWDCFQL
jgi:23S rRNA (uracil747-C5)-methyltransferase